jgi:RNA polymerase sigma factor (sigma-70 family)
VAGVNSGLLTWRRGGGYRRGVRLPSDALLQARTIAVRSAARIVGPEDAEDVAQETIARLLEQDPAGLQGWRGWVWTVAYRRALDLDAKEKRRRQILEGYRPRDRDVGPSEQGMRDHVMAQVLSVLSDRDAALLLAQLDGVPNAELAEQFGLASAATVSVTLNRIRARIRAAFPSADLRELLGEVPRVYDAEARGGLREAPPYDS